MKVIQILDLYNQYKFSIEMALRSWVSGYTIFFLIVHLFI